MASKGLVGTIIGITIALLLMGILLPIGLTDLVAYNGSYYNSSGSLLGTSSTMATLVGTVLPIMAVIGIVLGFVSKRNSD